VPDQNHVRRWRLVGLQPLAEVIPSHLYRTIGLIARVDLGVNDVGLCEEGPQVRVNMIGEGLERLVVAVEAVDVDDEQGTADL
jgi:hypothetical protein